MKCVSNSLKERERKEKNAVNSCNLVQCSARKPFGPISCLETLKVSPAICVGTKYKIICIFRTTTNDTTTNANRLHNKSLEYRISKVYTNSDAIADKYQARQII